MSGLQVGNFSVVSTATTGEETRRCFAPRTAWPTFAPSRTMSACWKVWGRRSETRGVSGPFLVCMGSQTDIQILASGFSPVQIKVWKTQRMGAENCLWQKYKGIIICQLKVEIYFSINLFYIFYGQLFFLLLLVTIYYHPIAFWLTELLPLVLFLGCYRLKKMAVL